MKELTSIFLAWQKRVTDVLGRIGWSIGKVLLLILTGIFVLFVLFAVFKIGFVYWIYANVENWIAVRLGFDYYVSNLLATCFVSVFSVLLPVLAWYLFLGKKQAWGIGILVGVQALMCLGVYTLGKSVCFNRRTGKPLCYFADTAQGRVWSYTPGFEPASGKPFVLYTREIKASEEKQNRR
jgi:hypothetical protein